MDERGDDYLARKDVVQQRLLDGLFRHAPGGGEGRCGGSVLQR